MYACSVGLGCLGIRIVNEEGDFSNAFFLSRQTLLALFFYAVLNYYEVVDDNYFTLYINFLLLPKPGSRAFWHVFLVVNFFRVLFYPR